MDSHLWHAYCTRSGPSEPTPLTLGEWKALPQCERRAHTAQLERWLAQFYINTAELDRLAQSLSRIVRRNAQTPPGAKDVALLSGLHLAGKSTFTKRWARGRYAEWTAGSTVDARGRPVWYPAADAENDFCPVVWINLQSGALRTDFDSQFLGFLGLPGASPARAMTSGAIAAVQRHRVRMVVVDDVQLLKTHLRKGREVLDHVKHINTELGENGASLVLIGANLVGGDLVTDPQVAGRLKLMTFPQYDIDNVDQQRSWQRILRDVETQLLPHLPAGKEGMFFTDLAGELWFRTQGFLGDLMELIREATLAATDDGTHKVLRRHLDAVVLSERAETERRARESPTQPTPSGRSAAIASRKVVRTARQRTCGRTIKPSGR